MRSKLTAPCESMGTHLLTSSITGNAVITPLERLEPLDIQSGFNQRCMDCEYPRIWPRQWTIIHSMWLNENKFNEKIYHVLVHNYFEVIIVTNSEKNKNKKQWLKVVNNYTKPNEISCRNICVHTHQHNHVIMVTISKAVTSTKVNCYGWGLMTLICTSVWPTASHIERVTASNLTSMGSNQTGNQVWAFSRSAGKSKK